MNKKTRAIVIALIQTGWLAGAIYYNAVPFQRVWLFLEWVSCAIIVLGSILIPVAAWKKAMEDMRHWRRFRTALWFLRMGILAASGWYVIAVADLITAIVYYGKDEYVKAQP